MTLLTSTAKSLARWTVCRHRIRLSGSMTSGVETSTLERAPESPRAHLSVCWALLAALLALAAPAGAQAPATVNVSVDATAAGTPLQRVWAFHGYDELNYTTTPEGTALLGTLAAAHSAPVHVRN